MVECEPSAMLGFAQDDFGCPICMSMFKDPFVTDCGHSFCFQCITTHLLNKKSCPCCSTYVTAEKIHPNFVLHKVVDKVSKASVVRKLTPPEMMVQLITEDRAHLKLEDVNKLLHLLGERKRLLEQQDAESNLQLLLQFLRHSRQAKAKQLVGLQSELKLLEADIKQVAGRKAIGVPLDTKHSQQTQPPGSAANAIAANGAIPPQAASLAPANALLTAVAALPGSEASQPSGSAAGNLTTPLAIQLPHATVAAQQDPNQQHAVAASCALEGSMSRASNGYLMITNPHTAQPVPACTAGTAHTPAIILGTAAATATPGLPVAPPTQLGADGSMHIHPRHLAFQHFQQQQAALQQRQQQPGGGQGLASALSLDSTDGDRMDRAASLASAQSDAIRHRRRRLLSQFEDLQQCYLRLRNPKKRSAQPSPHQQPPSKEQPVKRIKPDPDSAPQGPSQGPSDSASSDPLSHAHPAGPNPARHTSVELNPTEQHQQQLSGVQHPSQQGLSTSEAQGTAVGHASTEKKVLQNSAVNGKAQHGGKAGAGAEGTSQPAPQQHHSAKDADAVSSEVVGPADEEGLAEFSRMLSVFTHCARLKVIAQLPRTSNAHCSNILSSIEFDRDGQIFATAGVSKRISMYDYSAVMACPNAETHTPSQELVTRSKLSCLSWNKYLRTYLASSDYEGVVHVWDIATGQNVVEYEAHEKRIWSVDFCQSDPTLLMSGSDDGMVKIWSSNQAGSVAEIDIKANVCCAKYNPESMYKIAVGAADHTVHTYDLRKADKAVHVFRGHRKAVSYVRYLNGNELVSASTDSTLRLWDTQSCVNTRVFNGHSNEKNFVGLSVSDDFVSCGSETNEVFVYYKAMSKPVSRRLFSTPAEAARHAHNQDPSQFISAVCWKPDSQVLLSANSQGTIKVMQVTA